MSWDCETCGNGKDVDHSKCREISSLRDISDELREIKELLKKLLEK